MPRGSRKLTPILDCTLFGSVVDLPTSYAMIGGTPTQYRTPSPPLILGIGKGLSIECEK